MTTDNITPIRTGSNQVSSSPITIETVIDSMEEWRLSKQKLNEKIPEHIWDQIFTLVKFMSESRVLKVLGLSQRQFLTKKLEREISSKSQENGIKETEVPPINEVMPNNQVTTNQRIGLDSRAFAKPPNSKDSNKELEFCEVKPEPYPLVGKPAKAFATNTCVVELIRPDGMLMKIHTCTERFDELLRAFYNGNGR